MYRILFASPVVEAVTWWDICDGAWLGAPSGLLRKDNSLKPVYKNLNHILFLMVIKVNTLFWQTGRIVERKNYKAIVCNYLGSL